MSKISSSPIENYSACKQEFSKFLLLDDCGIQQSIYGEIKADMTDSRCVYCKKKFRDVNTVHVAVCNHAYHGECLQKYIQQDVDFCYSCGTLILQNHESLFRKYASILPIAEDKIYIDDESRSADTRDSNLSAFETLEGIEQHDNKNCTLSPIDKLETVIEIKTNKKIQEKMRKKKKLYPIKTEEIIVEKRAETTFTTDENGNIYYSNEGIKNKHKKCKKIDIMKSLTIDE